MASGVRRKKGAATATAASRAKATKRSRTALDLAWTDSAAAADDDDDHDEYLASSESDQDDHVKSARSRGKRGDQEEDESSQEENVEARRIRLAREYLSMVDARSDDSSSIDEDDTHLKGKLEDRIGDHDDDDDDEEEDPDSSLTRKLQRDRLKRQGTLERALADKVRARVSHIQHSCQPTLATEIDRGGVQVNDSSWIVPDERHYDQLAQTWVDQGHIQLLPGHDLTPTCVAMEASGSRAISGSKDHSVILWDTTTTQRITNLLSHWKDAKDKANLHHLEEPNATATNAANARHKTGKVAVDTRTAGQVLSVALSDDGRYAAVGKRDGAVRIFDIRSSPSVNLVKVFHGHKGAVTCLAFRSQTLQLFSGSEDRCIRHYDLEQMLYLETLYGHQFGVAAVDCHRQERPISVGKDRTARAWKIAENSHLIFRGGAKVQSAEAVSVIKDDWFLTGHEDGLLSLWMTDKKKAVALIDHAHGLDPSNGLGRSVASVASCRGSDLAATGSSDGALRFWRVRTGSTVSERGLDALSEVPLRGYINGICIGPKAKFCLAAVGQEHRCGRWNRIPRAKNRLAIIRLHSAGLDEVADSLNQS